MNDRRKIIISLNSAWNIVNFRSGLVRALLNAGYDVVAVAPPDKYVDALKKLGCRYIPLPMDSNGTHPGRDLILWWRFYRLLRAEKPSVFLGFTVKPNVYGSIAAHALGIPVINNVAGLGSVFGKKNWLTGLVKKLYGFALSRSAKVFFQNDEDRALFVESELVKEDVVDRLPGSGVDLSKFKPVPLPNNIPVRFLLIARMLWEKGVGEYVEAARMLRAQGVQVDCCLLGFLDVENPAAISSQQMEEWANEGVVRYLGVSDNVSEEIAKVDCVVLPSFYREGTPRTLLEAAAMARPIITTDSVGCREVVDDGVNGFLCIPKSITDLADKMFKLAILTHEERTAMGWCGREKVEEEFDEELVIAKYLKAIEAIVN